MTAKQLPITLINDDGDEITLPTKWAICDNCQGEGTHVNRAIDGHGISADDECWQDDDFTEMYFGGGYDVQCDAGCDHGKVKVINEDLMTEAQIKEYWEQIQDWREAEQVQAMELRMGC